MNTGMCIVYCDPLTEQERERLERQWEQEGLHVNILGFGITDRHDFGLLLLHWTQEPPESFLERLEREKNVLDFALYTLN